MGIAITISSASKAGFTTRLERTSDKKSKKLTKVNFINLTIDFDISGQVGSGKWFTDKNGLNIIDTVGGYFGDDGLGIIDFYKVLGTTVKIGLYIHKKQKR